MPGNQPPIKVTDPVFKRLLRRGDGFVLPHDANHGLVVLLRGEAGTGKSTLALQLLHLMETTAPRYYCTLEQSKGDLQIKLASMLAARAIHAAITPSYPCQTDAKGHFFYKADELYNHLKTCLGEDTTLDLQVTNACKDVTIPLYDEPDGEQKKKIETMHGVLADLVWERLKTSERISIHDGNLHSLTSASGNSSSTARSRVVLATHIIDHLVEKTKESRSKKKNRDRKIRSLLPIVVMDGLSLLSTPEREAVGLQRIVDLMRRRFQLGLLVYEPNDEETTSLDHHADMVIDLASRTIERPLAYMIHELCIRKARYQEAALGQHQFKIRDSGIAIFPSLHFQVHHYNYMDLELKRSAADSWVPSQSKNEHPTTPDTGSLIDLIFNPQPGESVVLLGSRNSFKTQLCLDFLSRGCWGCPHPSKGNCAIEQGLLISLIDNAPDIERGLICPWKKSLFQANEGFCSKACESELLAHARPFCQRPGCITPAEFFHYVIERLNLIPAKDGEKEINRRVVFWDLTQMDYRFPLFKEDKMLLPALMDMLKIEKVKALFMGAGNAENTKGASAMADHVLFCWRSNYIPKDNGAIKDGSIASLMLYVDRTSAGSGQSGKALYRIPVHTGDKLQIPMSLSTLNNFFLPLSNLELEEDKRQIERITNMQGVE